MVYFGKEQSEVRRTASNTYRMGICSCWIHYVGWLLPFM